MNPNEFVDKLKQYDINVTTRTLLNYEQAGLISEPERGGRGRGGGKLTEYQDEVVYEFIASYWLTHSPDLRVSKENAVKARKTAKMLLSKKWTKEEYEAEFNKDMIGFFIAFHWLMHWEKACANYKADDKVSVYYVINEDNTLVRHMIQIFDKNETIKIGVW